ncbi:hypothetical protein [Bradyrhizobium sp. SZCCHNS3002]|uniref:hypothetical protein n=1 Tax=Bradyrhizobium sp. SZCCHNS3002 TaxID=3057310 RepID=UPI0028EC76B8|nr:hypothetical protein [Bradyrhizobium sp. SZCCHNS3002]
MAKKRKHLLQVSPVLEHATDEQVKVELAADRGRPKRFKLDNENIFEIPNEGKFKVCLEKRYVEQVAPAGDKVIMGIFDAITKDPRIHLFCNVGTFRNLVPSVAELSRSIENITEVKPRFVLGVRSKADKDATIGVEDIEIALRDHPEVDAHVVMVPEDVEKKA